MKQLRLQSGGQCFSPFECQTATQEIEAVERARSQVLLNIGKWNENAENHGASLADGMIPERKRNLHHWPCRGERACQLHVVNLKKKRCFWKGNRGQREQNLQRWHEIKPPMKRPKALNTCNC